LLELIEKGVKMPKDKQPKVEKKKPLPPQATATVDVLRMLLKVVCAENGVAPKLGAGAEDLEAIELSDKDDVLVLKGWRHELFGKEALALKKGDLAIGLKGDKITKFRIKKNADTYDE